MRRVLLLLLIPILVSIVGCVNGKHVLSSDVQSRLKIRVERQTPWVMNKYLTVYAMDFYKEGHTLTFVCPCHVAGEAENWIDTRMESDLFNMPLLHMSLSSGDSVGVQYWPHNVGPDVGIQYWATKADYNSYEVKFKISDKVG